MLFATMDDMYVGIIGGGFNLGIQLDKQLDLPESKVAEMKSNLCSPSQRREAYLDLYANGHPCPSWRQVFEALRSIDLHQQADTVESTYIPGST